MRDNLKLKMLFGGENRASELDVFQTGGKVLFIIQKRWTNFLKKFSTFHDLVSALVKIDGLCLKKLILSL